MGFGHGEGEGVGVFGDGEEEFLGGDAVGVNGLLVEFGDLEGGARVHGEVGVVVVVILDNIDGRAIGFKREVCRDGEYGLCGISVHLGGSRKAQQARHEEQTWSVWVWSA